MDDLPVVVIGAGPLGLAAAAHLLERGLEPLVAEERLWARAVIDTSGTWRQPNPAGADGLPALGERAAADLSFLTEMRLDLDPMLQAPRKIAPRIDPNVHSCGTAAPTLVVDLAQPEPGLYLAGMKSYGRAPTFLAMTGYEQVRSIAAELAGDREAATRSELVLPDTGVYGGAGLFDDPDGAGAGGCCAPTPQLLHIGSAPARA